jgi:peptidoglycan/LPS O-acetylase OafA/YrhL
VCALLVNEHQRTGGIRFGAFWLRRARRLLPAVVVVIGATLVVTSFAQPDRLAQLRGDAVAALEYRLNWHFIFDQRSYFDAASGPSALEHLWSLSIEEQFYLVFPLLCGLALVKLRRRQAVLLALGGALAATALRYALFHPGGDASRVYFGTDTRAAGLLAGVALGLFWTPNRLRAHADRAFVRALDAVALVAALVVGWYAFTLTDRDAAAFRGGFTAVDLATLALVAVAVYPAPTVTAGVLSRRPMRWVGARSYGIYLIHWPVIVLLAAAPGQQPEGLPRTALIVALTLGLAGWSYRFVELPIRRRGFRATARSAWARVEPLVRVPTGATAMALFGLLILAAFGLRTASVVWSAEPDPSTASQRTSVVIPRASMPQTTSAPTTTAPPTTAAHPRPTAAPPPTTAPPPPGPYVPTTAVGDSVLVGASQALHARMGAALAVDAEVGRQFSDARDILAQARARGQLGRVVVIELGTNGPITADQIEQLFGVIGPGRKVVLVNVFVPRRWEGEVNDALAQAAARHLGTALVDWHAAAQGTPGLIGPDGFHLTPAGAQRYAELITRDIPRS